MPPPAHPPRFRYRRSLGAPPEDPRAAAPSARGAARGSPGSAVAGTPPEPGWVAIPKTRGTQATWMVSPGWKQLLVKLGKVSLVKVGNWGTN